MHREMLSLQQFMGSWRYLGLPQPGDRHDVMGLTSRGILPVMLLTMLLWDESQLVYLLCVCRLPRAVP